MKPAPGMGAIDSLEPVEAGLLAPHRQVQGVPLLPWLDAHDASPG